jgi:hypothetical protein
MICKRCGAELTEDNRYRDKSKARSYCVDCYNKKRREDYKECTKNYCNVCGEEINKNNTYRSESSHSSGNICKVCRSNAVNSYQKSLKEIEFLYIERGRYPDVTLTWEKLPLIDNQRKIAASFSTVEKQGEVLLWSLSIPIKEDGMEIRLRVLIGCTRCSDYDQFRIDRRIMKSSGREAHEPIPPKTGKRVTLETVARKRVTVDANVHCKYCDHDVVRYDKRGFKYCEKCYSIQDASDPIDDEGVPSGNHEEPNVYDPVYSAFYRQRNPKAVGVDSFVD